MQTVSETNFEDLKLVARGKVRDVYEVDDAHLLIVATDRISAFDCILPTAIERKGEVLTKISKFWFDKLNEINVSHHLITTEIETMPKTLHRHAETLRGRSMFVKKTKVFPVECVVRGYIAGSGWKDYQNSGEICGHKLPETLRESEKLPETIFTPATKAESGHDENISEIEMSKIIGVENTDKLKRLSLMIYNFASEYALKRGIIIADTKFEFGVDETGDIILIDEVLTPDSSRFWSIEKYEIGKSQASFDKQFVRDYLETLRWNKQPPAPNLPPEIANATSAKYLEAYKLLTEKDL
ncbi:MAG: phosphoribosylaminoimidazolesuccinocarboxamide synthase [Pyrinomonadaceae bacterium]|nr:phosphoribosylaminoimidazolesuccinocarboxamide synthase [Pyrinomonadaceae bacterium]